MLEWLDKNIGANLATYAGTGLAIIGLITGWIWSKKGDKKGDKKGGGTTKTNLFADAFKKTLDKKKICNEYSGL